MKSLGRWEASNTGAIMPRYVFGPGSPFTEPTPPVQKTDVDSSLFVLKSIMGGGNVVVTMPAIDPTLHNIPTAIHIVYQSDRHPDNPNGLDLNDPANVFVLAQQNNWPVATLGYTVAGDFGATVAPAPTAGATSYVQLIIEYPN